MFAEYLSADEKNNGARMFPAAGTGGISDSLQAALKRHTRKFKKDGTLLLEEDDCQTVYCVFDGWLSVSKALEAGQNQIIDFALPGDIVDPAGADGTTSSVTIDALTDGSLAAMPYRSWEKMIADLPELNHFAHLLEAAKRARRAERMLRLGKGTAEMRVAYALVEFCVRLDPDCGAIFREFHVPLTQQQLGDYVGISSVHVCRTMRRMSRNGILEMRDHMDLRILEPKSLAKLAGVDIETLKREIVPSGT